MGWSFVLWFSFVTMTTGAYGQSMQDMNQLHQDLLIKSNYSKHIRPAVDQSLITNVNFTFDLVSIRELDEILGKLSIVGIIWMSWEDPRLTWNPASYGNAIYTKLDMKKVWKPDLIIAHPIEPITAVGFDHYHYPVTVYYNGFAYWAPGDVMTTTCKINVEYYPFDTQTCEVTFIHWGSFQTEIFLHAAKKEISTKFFVGNGEWDLKKSFASEGLIDNTFPTYSVVLELKRRPTFIIVNVIMPILFMGLLNVLVFFVPAQSGERVSFSMTVLLAIAVFLTLVGDNMPKTSEPMSTICYFLLTNLVLSALIMITTILNLNIFHRSDAQPVPHWLAYCVLISCCKRAKRTKVEDIAISEDDVPEIVFKKERRCSECVIEKKWATADADEVNNVKWQDVSKMFDIVFGSLAFVWLTVSAATFFGMVSMNSVPSA